MNEITLSSVEFAERGLLSGQYWGELRIFAEVARARSFNRAAERLGLSQPTIGRKVRRLQDVIGAQLFVATKQGVHLTERGGELATALFRLDQSLFAIASDLKARANEAEGLVSVSITDGLSAFIAAPGVATLAASFPKIQLHLKSPGTLSSLRENGTDMLVTPHPIDASDCKCVRLGTLHFVPIASRDYLALRGIPTRGTLGDHQIIQSHAYAGENPIWKAWQDLCARGRIAHHCDNPFAYGMMVRSGMGIGLLGTYTISDPNFCYLDFGVHVPVPMYAVVLRERLTAKPVQYVFDWLCEIFGSAVPCFADDLDLESPKHDLTRAALFRTL